MQQAINVKTEHQYFQELRAGFSKYYPISDSSWNSILAIIHFKTILKGDTLLRTGEMAKYIHFVCQGAFRTYFTSDEGNYYNKNLFMEGDFPASKVSLLCKTPSYFAIEALEDALVININFDQYRELINKHDDLKNFYIAYIEQNWIIEKERREISLVMDNATTRYLALREKYPEIDTRIPQLHIAAHLGITPTQLSRIRKELKK